MRSAVAWSTAALVGTLVAACSGGYFAPRQLKAQSLAEQAGWSYRLIAAGDFDIVSVASPLSAGVDPLTVYVEGDGLAFLDRVTPSPDPTPDDPVALRLAIAAPQRPAAYVARPCQFVMADHPRNCAPTTWTSRRYAPEVVATMDRAIDSVKSVARVQRIVLIGYSGGGVLAVLLAARRTDVAGIVTVAANLDLAYWTSRNHLAPLVGSLDPTSVAERVAGIPQVHFSGSRDEIAGADVVRSYLSHLPQPNRARAVEIDGFDHNCCWVESWPMLMQRRELEIIPAWKR